MNARTRNPCSDKREMHSANERSGNDKEVFAPMLCILIGVFLLLHFVRLGPPLLSPKKKKNKTPGLRIGTGTKQDGGGKRQLFPPVKTSKPDRYVQAWLIDSSLSIQGLLG